jgi:uncharacterized membrane protein
MTRYLAAYGAGALTLFVIDMIWLGFVARDFYQRQLGDMLLDRPLYGPAAAFYLLYVVGVVFFAVVPALNGGGWTTALLHGAVLGLMCYGTYDMSNLATLKNWPPLLTVVDIAWGAALTAATAVAAYAAAARVSG